MKKLLFVLLILALIGGAVAYWAYQTIFSPNVLVSSEAKEVYIPTGTDYDGVLDMLQERQIITSSTSFDRVAGWMSYKAGKISPGKYSIGSNWTNKQLVSLLRSGRQSSVNVTFNNLRTKEELAGKISSYLEIDSLELVRHFQDEAVYKQNKVTAEDFLTLFIPNTYEFFWTAKKEDVVKRLVKEHDDFWSKNNRLEKAKERNLSPSEVYTLASIVEKESLRNDEKPIIAGVYQKRLEIGMPLQADPTVVFANGDFGLRRVLNRHLEFDSPYNTYKYAGLPPGPIYMPSISSIDAVLAKKTHNYLYFCANPDLPGGHLFAADISQHNANARRYHRWLNSRGIR